MTALTLLVLLTGAALSVAASATAVYWWRRYDAWHRERAIAREVEAAIGAGAGR